MSKEDNHQDLLGIIPTLSLKQQQQHIRWRDGDVVYQLLREPYNLHEFKQFEKERRLIVLHDNGTITFIYPRSWRNLESLEGDKNLILTFYENELCTMACAITGSNDDAIAETASFFWSLYHPVTHNNSLVIHQSKNDINFDFRAVRSEQLAHMFETNPTRNVEFSYVTINAEQSIILASRLHPVHLRLTSFCVIEDYGNAFTDALCNRQSSIGSLSFTAIDCQDDKVWLSDINLHRILKNSYIDKLELDGCFHDNLIPSLFSSPIQNIRFDDCQVKKTQRVNIAPGILSLELSWGITNQDHSSMLSYLSHLNDRNLTKLSVFISNYDKAQDKEIKNVIRFIGTQSNLEFVRWSIPLESAEIMKELFEVLQQHKGLRTFQIVEFPYSLDQRHEFLRNLLQRNRVIQVTDMSNQLVTNGEDIKSIYSLNRFYCGLMNLGQETCLRNKLSLIGTTLMQSTTATNFQRIALLLAKQTDAFCDLIQMTNTNEDQTLIVAKPTEAIGELDSTSLQQDGVLVSDSTLHRNVQNMIPITVTDLFEDDANLLKRKSCCKPKCCAKRTAND